MTEIETPDLDTDTDTDTAIDPAGSTGSGRGLWILLLVAVLVLGGAVGWRIGRAQEDTGSPSHTSVDVGFFQDMSLHHNQAIGMAFAYLATGTDPLLRQISGEIVTYQASEMGVMGEYLTKWGQAGTEGATAMGWMGMATPRNQMTGLATKHQLAQLDAARGAALNQEFTRLMIDHHAGGVHMAEYAARHATTPDVKRWAASMASGQRDEISELNRWRIRNGFPAVVVHRN